MQWGVGPNVVRGLDRSKSRSCPYLRIVNIKRDQVVANQCSKIAAVGGLATRINRKRGDRGKKGIRVIP